MTETATVAVEPKSGRYQSLEQAVIAGGARLSTIDEADALVWADPDIPHELPAMMARARDLSWVGLPFAGIEPYVPFLDHERVWTCARGVYARPVAEHVMALGLAGLRGLVGYAQASTWTAQLGRNLIDGKVVIFGAGGITNELLVLLAGFNCEVTVVGRQPDPVEGATRTVGLDRRLTVLDDADLVVLALALTPETEGVIGEQELAAMSSHTWLINVARGAHVDNEALVAALDRGLIAGACLDVTEPEPLPDTHPLWSRSNVLITPHVGNTPEMGVPLLADHIEQNVSRFCAGEPLLGVIDVEAGY